MQLDNYIEEQRKRKADIDKQLAQSRYLSHGYSPKRYKGVKREQSASRNSVEDGLLKSKSKAKHGEDNQYGIVDEAAGH